PGERAHSWRDAAELHGAAGAATHRGDGIPSADVPRVRWRRREDDALLRPRLPLLVPPPALEGVVAPYRAVEVIPAVQLVVLTHRRGLRGWRLSPAVAAPALGHAVRSQRARVPTAGAYRDEATGGRGPGGRRLTVLVQEPALHHAVIPQCAGMVVPCSDLHEPAGGCRARRCELAPAVHRAVDPERAGVIVPDRELSEVALPGKSCGGGLAVAV